MNNEILIHFSQKSRGSNIGLLRFQGHCRALKVLPATKDIINYIYGISLPSESKKNIEGVMPKAFANNLNVSIDGQCLQILIYISKFY